MSCEEFLRRLDQGEPMVAGDAATHAAACPTCARALARRNAVADELSAMADEPAPPFLHARIMAHVRAGRRARAVGWRFALAAAAAIVVLAVGTYFLLRPAPALAPTQLAERLTAAPDHDYAQSHTNARERQVTAVGRVRAPAPLAMRRADKAAAPQVRRTEAGAGTVAQVSAAARAAAGETGAEHAATERKAQATDQEGGAGVALATQVAAPLVVDESKRTTAASNAAADRLRPAPENAPGLAATASDARQLPQPARAAQTRAESEFAAPDTTVCAIRTTAGQVLAHLALPTALAPPVDVVWTLVVGHDGALAVRDARDRAVTLDGTRLAAALGPVRLPPGRYTLLIER